MRQKKAVVDWMIVVGAIIAIVVGFTLLYIVPKGLFAGGKNIDYLSSCKSKGGICEVSDNPSKNCFFKSGCPDENGDGKVDSTEEKKDYCCIKKEK